METNKKLSVRSIWFWWILTTLIYISLYFLVAFSGLDQTPFAYLAGFIGLFVPYGFMSLFYSIFTLPGVLSILFFMTVLFFTEKFLTKKEYSLTKIILINLIVLLVVTTVVDFIRLTPLASWTIFLNGRLF